MLLFCPNVLSSERATCRVIELNAHFLLAGGAGFQFFDKLSEKFSTFNFFGVLALDMLLFVHHSLFVIASTL